MCNPVNAFGEKLLKCGTRLAWFGVGGGRPFLHGHGYNKI